MYGVHKMKRGDLADLSAFTVVASEGSFTRAAARLGMSQSALSHAMRALEERLGVRLLNRTTRSVATTEAGEELLRSLRPAFDEIKAGVSVLGGKRDTPSGTVRLTMTRQAARSIIEPVLPGLMARYPDIRIEVDIDDGFTDIVASRFDAGIRFGESLEQDMIALRVGPDVRAALVASPAYLAAYGAPESPRALEAHRCINYRLVSAGALHAWAFQEEGRRSEVRVDGVLIFNDGDLIVNAALDGLGIAYVFDDQVAGHLASGRLVRLLDSWCVTFPGYYLYYPSRRHTPPALAVLIAALQARGT